MAEQPRLRFPAPIVPDGERPSTQPSQPQTRVTVNFPPAQPPLSLIVVRDNQLRGLNILDSEVFAWPRAGPLGISVSGTLNGRVRLDLMGSLEPTTARPLAQPLLSLDVAASGNDFRSLHPDEDWAPNVWVRVTPIDNLTDGSIRVELVRLGDL